MRPFRSARSPVPTPANGAPQPGAAVPSPLTQSLRAASQALPALGLALMPKCPMCLVMYLGFLTALGVDAVVAARITEAGLIIIGGFILLRVWRGGETSAVNTPFWLGLAGLAGLCAAYYAEADPLLRWPAMALFFAGCLLHARRHPSGPMAAPAGGPVVPLDDPRGPRWPSA